MQAPGLGKNRRDERQQATRKLMNMQSKVNTAGSTPLRINAPAPLRNVVNFGVLLEKVVERRPDLPGLATFYGPSGYGKTKSAISAANRYRAAYVECGQFTTAKSLMASILLEIGVPRPRGTITDMIEEAIRIMAGDIRRPLIIDEAHHVAHKRFIDLVRELHDKSMAPIVLIGEETLPKQLEAYERVHNRMLEWVPALPCNSDDLSMLVRVCHPRIKIAPDLASAILEATRGNTRRIVVNLAKVEELAAVAGTESMDLATFGGPSEIIGSKAPNIRRAV